ncbi:uncharacterized protein LOC127245027 [Andrographis paniculata]|uniref:uncharacterized protein LOC127245027 n=1 Tax=Andrographis paniculata TaxID=175694 RepID=UPI0021E8419B|nr:uncharacterized protein LOC127245027 [Andrographis paniculata]
MFYCGRKVVWTLFLVLACLLVRTNGSNHLRRRLVRCEERGDSNHGSSRRCRGYYACPAECPQACFVDCRLCRAVCRCDIPGAVCQDPRFIGGDGVSFYFHGRKGHHFCLVSDAHLHINAHFIGKRSPRLTRDFTWVQSIGVMFRNHTLLIAAQRTPTAWDDALDRIAITLDGTPADNSTALITIVSRTTNAALVQVAGAVEIAAAAVPVTAEESRAHGYGVADDCLAHLELGFKFYNLSDAVEGVLGQTYRTGYVSRVNVSAAMPVMGGAHKFRTSGIFKTDCRVSRFRKA